MKFLLMAVDWFAFHVILNKNLTFKSLELQLSISPSSDSW